MHMHFLQTPEILEFKDLPLRGALASEVEFGQMKCIVQLLYSTTVSGHPCKQQTPSLLHNGDGQMDVMLIFFQNFTNCFVKHLAYQEET